MDQGGFDGRRSLRIVVHALLSLAFLSGLASNGLADEPPLPAPAQQDMGEGAQPAPQRAPPRAMQLQVQGQRMLQVQQLRARQLALALNRSGGAGGDAIFFPADRLTLQRLAQAQELLEAKRYSEAATLLGEILDGPEDYFFQPHKDQPIYRSLKGEAQRIIGEMPDAGREAYELIYGALARRSLEAAIQKGNYDALAEVSRRAFHTEAGYLATFLLGGYEYDHGRPLAAALCFQRLQSTPSAAKKFEPGLTLRLAACWARAGMLAESEASIAALKQQWPEARLELAGKPLARNDSASAASLAQIFAGAEARPGRGGQQWTMHLGNASRNLVCDGSSPLLVRRWSIPVADGSANATEMIAKLSTSMQERGVVPLSSLYPLAVDGVVFMRTINGLVAIDFATGKRIWPGSVEPAIQKLLDPAEDYQGQEVQVRGPAFANRFRNVAGQARLVEQIASNWVSDRLWADAVYGRLSSDGQRVFAVEDLLDVNAAPLNRQTQIVRFNGRRTMEPSGPRTHNRLAAYDIATQGKLVWELGGPAGEADNPLAGAFFLGPPLPLDGNLYALIELQGEVRLAAIDGSTGALAWSQQLAVLEANILQDTERRLTGAMPSYCDGVLVCPTAAGAVVAVDLTTRSLLWGYSYLGDGPEAEQRALRLQVNAFQPGMPYANDRWADGTAVIAGGRVLLTPPESNKLHCLNLLDGSLLWEAPREDGLYVACVDADRVAVVGRGSVRAFAAPTGQPAWQAPLPLPENSVPSGRGFFNGKHYLLPLSTAEVASIDLEHGIIAARSKSRDGLAPGNLICFQGAVLSQTGNSLERFDQREDLWQRIAAALEKNPRDKVALARRGELLLDEGKPVEAVASLELAYEQDQDPRIRELYVESLIEALRRDFSGRRASAAKIKDLIKTPAERSEWLRAIAVGLEEQGEPLRAFLTYLELAKYESADPPLDEVGPHVSVRRDRWIQARLFDLWSSAPEADQAQMTAQVLAARKQAIDAGGADALQRFLNMFGALPHADAAREILAVRLAEAGDLLGAERLLGQLESRDDVSVKARAAAQLAAMLNDSGRFQDAAIYYQKLASEFADVVCNRDRTGAQIVAQLPKDSEARQALAVAGAWPVGRVDQLQHEQSRTATSIRSLPVDLLGDARPFFKNASIEVQQQQPAALICRDQLGRQVWQAPLYDAQRPGIAVNALFHHARTSGHLIVLSVGVELVAIDALGGGSRRPGQVLWRQQLVDPITEFSNLGLRTQSIQAAWGAPRMVAADGQGRPFGMIGHVTSDIVCYQRLNHLVAADPMTGETLWTRTDLPAGSDMFGDDRLVFVAPPNSEEAVVLSAFDGAEIARRPIAPSSQRVTLLGRKVLSWTPQGGEATLALADVWTGEYLWQRTYSSASKAFVLGDRSIGVLEPDGKFDLCRIDDGALEIDSQVEPEPRCLGIYVVESDSTVLLVTNRPSANNENGLYYQAVPGGLNNPLIDGMAHVFNRQTGERIASTRIEKQGLHLGQPQGLPVLAFATIVHDQRQNQTRRITTRMMMLDKRTGKTVFESEFPRSVNHVDVVGDPANNAVVVQAQTFAVRLTFTGEPETAPPLPDPGKQASSPSRPSPSDAARWRASGVYANNANRTQTAKRTATSATPARNSSVSPDAASREASGGKR